MQVAIEISVGQVTQRFEFGKHQPIGVSYEAGYDAQPRLLMKDSLQAVIGKRSRLGRFRFVVATHASRSNAQ